MKNAFLVTAAFTVLVVGQVHAQTKNFDGFSLGVNVQSESAASNATDGTSDSGRSSGLGLQAKYDWSFGHHFVLGLGATASTENRQAGTYMSGSPVYSNNRYTLDVEPGYAINNKLLVYGKASSVSASVAADDGVSSVTVQGLGYGVGLRAMIDRNVYWQVGYDTYKLNDAAFGTGTTASLQGSVVSLGLGYKF